MNFIVISPFFPPNFQLFPTRLKEEGVRVLGIGSEPYEQLGQQLHEALTEYYQVENMENWNQVARAVAFFYHKYGKIDRIESHNEYWLELDAYLRTEFNVVGLKTEDLRSVKYKSKMKELFRQAGAPVVNGYLVNNPEDLKNTLREVSLPVIAKPDNGVGTAATYRLDNSEDVAAFLNNWKGSIPYFIEEFVDDAELCTYDGLIDSQGNIVFETSFNYSMPTLDLLSSEIGVYYIVQKEIDPILKNLGRKIVKTFGHKERFFHIEFFRRKDGSYITLEYNGRLADAFTVDVYNHAHSIDLYREYARIVKGEKFEFSEREAQYGIAIGRRDTKEFENSIEDIVSKYTSNVKMVTRMPDALFLK